MFKIKNIAFENKSSIYLSIHVFIPIFIGGLIYVLFRTNNLLMFEWFKLIDSWGLIAFVRIKCINLKNSIPRIIIYSLPDSLWVYSLTNLMILIWHNDITYNKYIWISIGPILGIGGEILQYFKIIEGTFDFNDLILCISASLISILIYKKVSYNAILV